MNIRVDLNYPINDGTEVIFRSPVDCSEVTGLKVYYPENGLAAAKEFVFADAHGNNVGDIDHLFAENVVVKVILDVTTNMAFVQNADTNAYIEKTFIKKVNGIGPDKNGNVSLGGGANVLIVRTDGNQSDHLPSQMLSHLRGGGVVILDLSDTIVNLSYCCDTWATFAEINDDFYHFVHSIDADGNYACTEMQHANQEYIGDISTALDRIIEIQEELIGS